MDPSVNISPRPNISSYAARPVTQPILSGSISNNHQLTNKFLLLQFLRTYQDHVFPVLYVSSPITDPAELVQLPWSPVLDPAKKMCTYAVLATGARASCNLEYATELQHRSRLLMGEYFDTPTPFVEFFFPPSHPRVLLYRLVLPHHLDILPQRRFCIPACWQTLASQTRRCSTTARRDRLWRRSFSRMAALR